MRYSILLASLLCLAASCQKEPLITSTDRPIAQESSVEFPEVDERLWVYFQRFHTEATNRGISVNLQAAQLVGVIEEIAEEDVAGRCNYHSQLPNRITIDRQFWNRNSDLYREAVVFHELGHCQLLRDHREAQSNAGQCLSLMASGVENCQFAYTAQTRSAYLDELFDPAFAGDWF